MNDEIEDIDSDMDLQDPDWRQPPPVKVPGLGLNLGAMGGSSGGPPPQKMSAPKGMGLNLGGVAKPVPQENATRSRGEETKVPQGFSLKMPPMGNPP